MDIEKLEAVGAWLLAGEAADYQAGVLLLQEHCRNRNLVTQLLKKESPANREKLTYELLKLGTNGDLAQVSELQNLYAEAVKAAVPAPAAPPIPATPAPDVPAEQPAPDSEVADELRPQVDELTELMSRLYRERCQLSNSLAELDPARGPEVVAHILSLEQQYNALAAKRRNLVAGPPPATEAAPAPDEPAAPAGEEAPAGEPTAPGIDRAELMQQRNNLKSNISKTKGKLKTAQTEAKRSELAEKLAKLEVELTDVELKLKAPQA